MGKSIIFSTILVCITVFWSVVYLENKSQKEVVKEASFFIYDKKTNKITYVNRNDSRFVEPEFTPDTSVDKNELAISLVKNHKVSDNSLYTYNDLMMKNIDTWGIARHPKWEARLDYRTGAYLVSFTTKKESSEERVGTFFEVFLDLEKVRLVNGNDKLSKLYLKPDVKDDDKKDKETKKHSEVPSKND